MSARRTALDVAVWTLGGTAYLGDVVSHDYMIDVELADAKAAAERYAKKLATKRRVEISGELMHATSSARKCNLDLSAISIGGGSILPNVKGLEIGYTVASQESSGEADEWEYFQATGVEISGKVKILVPVASTTTIMATLGGTRSGLATTLAMTAGLFATSQPIVLKSGKLGTERDGLQEIDVDFMGDGAPSSATGAALFLVGLTGTAAAAYVLDYASQKFTGNLLVASGNMAVNDKEIIMEKYTFKGQGAPTVAAGGS